jgi:hypothetical protein
MSQIISIENLNFDAVLTLLPTLPLLPFIPSAIHYIIQSEFEREIQVTKDSHSLEGKYDYIIIGTDSGGPVMAARVSEDSTKTLLLLEMDSAENFISVITLVAIFLQKISIDWNFKTEPQIKSCFGLEARMSSSSRS